MTRARRRAFAPVPSLAALALALGGLAPPAAAAERALTLDPSATKIRFTLGATFHTAEGSLRLASGAVRFDDATGAASGEIVVDAKSAETGNGSRDAKMHAEVLESAKFPEIRFRAERLEVVSRTETSAEVKLHGRLSIHGGEHALAIPAKLRADGARLHVEAAFRVPYAEWGMKDVSNLVLRVDRYVDVTVEAGGDLSPP